jgi:hypothetical protein
VRVFLSYRRDDASGHAGRLHDDLQSRLGVGSVFQDVVSIGPGERYRRLIQQAIDASDVVIAVMGRNWAATDGNGRSRLADDHDVVRAEIETALAADRRVVPVLVDRAELPPAGSLPESLRPLLELNAIELRDEAWTADIRRLYDAIGVPSRTARDRRRGWLLAAGAVAVAVLAVLGWTTLRGDGGGDDTSSSSETPIAAPTDQPQPVPSAPVVSTRLADASGRVIYEVRGWWVTPEVTAGRRTVTLDAKVTDHTPESISIYPELFHLRSGGVDMGTPRISTLEGDESPGPDEATIVRVQFRGVGSEELRLLVGNPSQGRLVLDPSSGAG